MNTRILFLILDRYAYPERTMERNRTRQYGERKVKWRG